MRLKLRLSRIEEVLAASQQPPKLTYEERQVYRYEIASAMLMAGRMPERKQQFEVIIAEFTAKIRHRLAHPIEKLYPDHAEYVRAMWHASGRKVPYLWPLLGSDHEDWWLPDLPDRRMAVRRRPSILALMHPKCR